MTRQLTLTAAEWAVMERDREAWIVRPGSRPCFNPHKEPHTHPPAELVAAAAPCETCGGEREVWATTADDPRQYKTSCPDCRITLVGNPVFLRPSVEENASVTLGHAYADSEVQMIWRPGVPAEGTQWATLVAMLGFDPAADIGKYALKVVAA